MRTCGQPAGEPVGQRDRQRHELGGLVAGEAEHQALVAGALLVELVRVALDAAPRRPSSTPCAMSGLCEPMETETPQDSPSKPFLLLS